MTSKSLRLKAIRTKGRPSYPMTAIQLEFEGGIESPMLDTKSSYSLPEIRTTELSGRKIKKILSRASSDNGMTSNLRLEDDTGSLIEIYEKQWNNGDEMSREIPHNHHIVGVYGSFQ